MAKRQENAALKEDESTSIEQDDVVGGVITINATTNKSDRVVQATKRIGQNLEEAVALFGAEVVYSRFKQATVIEVQAIMRRAMIGETPKSDEEIQKLVAEHKPGITTRIRKTKKERALEMLEDLTDEDREALLEKLLAKA